MAKKAQNSVLLLTTLGVYIGLLVAGGAAPQVLAHSATTRNFEITDEIEATDRLDDKPDADAVTEQFAISLEEIYRVAAEISAENPQGVENGQYDFHYFVTVYPNGGYFLLSKPEFNTGLRTKSGRYGTPLSKLYDAFLPRTREKHEKLRIDFALTPTGLEFRANLFVENEGAARDISASLSHALTTRKEREIDARKALLYGDTKISFDRNQVTIVTRLPRASLDPLLAKDAK